MAKQHFLISLLPHVTPKSAWPTSIFLSAIYPQQLANQHFTPPAPFGHTTRAEQFRVGAKLLLQFSSSTHLHIFNALCVD